MYVLVYQVRRRCPGINCVLVFLTLSGVGFEGDGLVPVDDVFECFGGVGRGVSGQVQMELILVHGRERQVLVVVRVGRLQTGWKQEEKKTQRI